MLYVKADKKLIISKINTKLKIIKLKKSYKLNKNFELIPKEIEKKIIRNDFKLKKCTI